MFKAVLKTILNSELKNCGLLSVSASSGMPNLAKIVFSLNDLGTYLNWAISQFIWNNSLTLPNSFLCRIFWEFFSQRSIVILFHSLSGRRVEIRGSFCCVLFNSQHTWHVSWLGNKPPESMDSRADTEHWNDWRNRVY